MMPARHVLLGCRRRLGPARLGEGQNCGGPPRRCRRPRAVTMACSTAPSLPRGPRPRPQLLFLLARRDVAGACLDRSPSFYGTIVNSPLLPLLHRQSLYSCQDTRWRRYEFVKPARSIQHNARM